MNVKGKNIIITGGSLGIGKETAKSLVEKGANVLITGRSEKRLLEAKLYTNADILEFDISDFENMSENAKKCLEDLSINDFLKVFNVNVFGLSLFTKEIVPFMKDQKSGTIINIGSTASLKGYKTGSIYSSSKFAVRCLTQCWQAELRPFNIRVCQVNPSEVTTAFGNNERIERSEVHNKLTVREISHAIVSAIEMDERGFINELNVWATNPFN